jgi:hypothetical protein
MQIPIIWARAAIVALGLVEVSIPLWFRHWAKFRPWTLKRVVPWLISVVAVTIIPLVQLKISRRASSWPGHDIDVFSHVVFISEGCIVLILIFRFAGRYGPNDFL